MGGTEGRALHLLDIEYLGLGPRVTAGDLALVLDRYRPLTDWHPGDHLVGAAYGFNLARSLAESVDRVVASPSPMPWPPERDDWT